LGLFISIKKYFSLKSRREKTQLRYFIIGALIPGVFGNLVTFILALIFNVTTYQWLAFPLFALGYLFVAQGVLQHGLFVDYRAILETIFKGLVELVIVTDKEGLVLLTNKMTLSKLNYKEEEVLSRKVSQLFKGKEKTWQRLKEKLKKQTSTLEEKVTFKTKEGEEIPFLLALSQTKEGIIFVGRDIKELISYQEKLEEEVKERTRELQEAKTILEVKVKARTKELQELADSLEIKVKERTGELQARVEELERFHKLTVGRELKMIELKREVERLKKERG